jgi:hypothetical protein
MYPLCITGNYYPEFFDNLLGQSIVFGILITFVVHPKKKKKKKRKTYPAIKILI